MVNKVHSINNWIFSFHFHIKSFFFCNYIWKVQFPWHYFDSSFNSPSPDRCQLLDFPAALRMPFCKFQFRYVSALKELEASIGILSINASTCHTGYGMTWVGAQCFSKYSKGSNRTCNSNFTSAPNGTYTHVFTYSHSYSSKDRCKQAHTELHHCNSKPCRFV